VRSFAGAFYYNVITQTRFSEKKRCEKVFTEGVDNLLCSLNFSVRRILRHAPTPPTKCFVPLSYRAGSRTPFVRINGNSSWPKMIRSTKNIRTSDRVLYWNDDEVVCKYGRKLRPVSLSSNAQYENRLSIFRDLSSLQPTNGGPFAWSLEV
jgi:hypothetical protein